MKAIIYAGISLFSAATVYGVADYYGTKKNGVLDKMYKEESTTVAEKEKTSIVPLSPPELKNETIAVSGKSTITKSNTAKKVKKFKKPVFKIKLSDFSRGRLVPIEELKLPDSVKIK
jgi:hypothetical protein